MLEAGTDICEVCGPVKRRDDEGDEVQASQGRGQTFVVVGQAAEAGHPSKRTFHRLAPRQEDEAALGRGQSHHFQGDAALGRRLRRPLAP